MAAPPADLARFRGFILDLDGVLWEGDTPLPGMARFLSFLRAHGKSFLLATNNASLTPDQYVQKAARMGAEVLPQEVLTSALATAEFLRETMPPGSRVYVIGEDGLVQALSAAGFTVSSEDDLDAQVVVCGMDRRLSWKKLANATINLRNGARFIGTNPDTTFPTERGIAHGNGAILAALATASEVQPDIIGKPHAPIFTMALARLGLPIDAVVAVGDRLETDILGAKQAGIASILLMTGVTTQSDLESSPIKPGWVFADLPSLITALESAIP
jgi:4-nitrophenyl phosphatase